MTLLRMIERLWSEVEPIYRKLHCYTRAKLNEHYGACPATQRADPRRPPRRCARPDVEQYLRPGKRQGPGHNFDLNGCSAGATL